jgi:alpha-glucosidase (family GH31 glycosyl hydrolase)
MRKMFHLRSQLIPYIYSTSRQSEKESVPFIRPMYYDYPNDEKAYTFDEQYYLGDALLSSPISHPGEGEDKIAEKYVWVPEGTYYNFFTGEKVKSGSCIETYSSLDTFPLFIKGGFPLTMQPYTDRMTSKTPDTIIVKIYPSDTDCNNTFNLFDDDGISDRYLEGKCLNTAITYEQKGEEIDVSIIPDGGCFDGCPESRTFILELEQTEKALSIISSDCDCEISFDEEKKVNTVKFEPAHIHKSLKLKLI